MSVSASSPALLVAVLEKRPRWAPELQRQLLSQPIKVRPCRAVRDIAEVVKSTLATGGRAITVIDLAFGPGDVLHLIGALSHSRTASIVIGTEEMRLLEPCLRELGATSFHLLPLSGERLGRECLKLLKTETPVAGTGVVKSAR